MNEVSSTKEVSPTKVAVIGVGNMGLCWLGAALQAGYEVVAIDKDEDKLTALCDGSLLEGEEEVWKDLEKKFHDQLFTSSRVEAIEGTEIIFIAVQTPEDDEGGCNLDPLLSLLKDLRPVLQVGQVLLLGSTVFPSDIEEFILPLIPKGVTFAYEPVFLRAGTGVADYSQPGKIVVGLADLSPPKCLENLFSTITSGCEVSWCSFGEAEFIKLLHNTFMCVKISFVNEVASLCDSFGVDAGRVMELVFGENEQGRLLTRSHMIPGPPYSGTCLPKDSAILRGLLHREVGESAANRSYPLMLGAVQSNDVYVEHLATRLTQAVAGGGTIGVIGLTYRPGYNDIRDSLFTRLRKELPDETKIIGYDSEFEGLEEDRFNLCCRGDEDLLRLYKELTCSFDHVLMHSSVLLINCPLGKEMWLAMRGTTRTVIDLYQHFHGE